MSAMTEPIPEPQMSDDALDALREDRFRRDLQRRRADFRGMHPNDPDRPDDPDGDDE